MFTQCFEQKKITVRINANWNNDSFMQINFFNDEAYKQNKFYLSTNQSEIYSIQKKKIIYLHQFWHDYRSVF